MPKTSEREATDTYYSKAKGLSIDLPNPYKDLHERIKRQRADGVDDTEILDNLVRDAETASTYQRDYFAATGREMNFKDLVRIGDVFVDPYGRVFRYKFYWNPKRPENIALQNENLNIKQFEIVFSLATGWSMDTTGKQEKRKLRFDTF